MKNRIDDFFDSLQLILLCVLLIIGCVLCIELVVAFWLQIASTWGGMK